MANDKYIQEVETRFTTSGVAESEGALRKIQSLVDSETRAGNLSEKQSVALSRANARLSSQLGDTAQAHRSVDNSVRGVTDSQRGLNSALDQGSQGFVALRYAMYDVGRTALTASGAIAGVGVAAAAAFGSQERAFTEVQRIAEGSVDEVQYLREELTRMSTEIPRSFQNLSEIASLGGALGIESDALDEFTETVAKFTTLTNITEEAASTGFGRIAQYLKLGADEFDSLGSAILRAGNISVATEEQVLKFSSAIALPAARAGLLTDEVVALGAATASFANINVEGAGSAYSRVFSNIERAVTEGGESLESFASAAGYSADQFRVAWGSDAGGTFNRIIKGLSMDVTGLVGNLDALGIRNERDRRVVSALALNYEDYVRIIGETTNAWRDGIYMNEAYGLVLDDLVSKWDIFKNALSNAAAAVGSEAAPAMKLLLDSATSVLVKLTEFANTPLGGVLIRMASTVGVLSASILALGGVLAIAAGSGLAFRFALQQIAGSSLAASLAGLRSAIIGVGTASNATGGAVLFLNRALKALGRITIIGAALYAISELAFNTRESLVWLGEAFIWVANTAVAAMSAISPVLGAVAATGTHTLRDFGKSVKAWGMTFPAAADQIGSTSQPLSDFGASLDDLGDAAPDISGVGDAIDDVGKSAEEAAPKVYTLVDYANDLASVWKRAFDIRFSGQQSFDDIQNSLQKVRDASAESAKRILDFRNSIRSLSADITGLKSDINILEHYLKIAREYGDTKRATALEAELVKKRAELAAKTSDLSEKSKGLKKEQDSQNKSLVGNTQANRDNRATIEQLVQQYQAHIQKLAESGMSQDELARATQRLKEDFIKQATQLGYNRTELQRYAKSFDDVAVAIKNVPRNITVKANANPALQALNEFRAKATSVMAQAGTAAKNAFNEGVRGIGSTIPNTIPGTTVDYSRSFPTPYKSWSAFMDSVRKAGFPYVKLPGDYQRLAWLGQGMGFQSGGYTGRGAANETAGTVHKGEYVLRKDQVNQSTGLPYASALGQLMGGLPSRSVAAAPAAQSAGIPTVALNAATIQAIAQATGKNIYLNGKMIAASTSSEFEFETQTGAY